MKTLLFSLFLSTQVWAQVSTVEVKNFNFNYRAPTGEGLADRFSYQKSVQEAQVVKVERIGDEFKILLEGTEDRELIWKNAPELIQGADVIKLTSLNLGYASDLSLTAVSGFFQSPLRILSFDNLSVTCDRTYVLKEGFEQLITGCFQRSLLKAQALIFECDFLLRCFLGHHSLLVYSQGSGLISLVTQTCFLSERDAYLKRT